MQISLCDWQIVSSIPPVEKYPSRVSIAVKLAQFSTVRCFCLSQRHQDLSGGEMMKALGT